MTTEWCNISRPKERESQQGKNVISKIIVAIPPDEQAAVANWTREGGKTSKAKAQNTRRDGDNESKRKSFE